jgi:hypothetical protein
MNPEIQTIPSGDIVQPGGFNNRKRYIRSLEYEFMANLTVQQYQDKENVKFDLLLSIPLTERIPALIQEYGLRRMHRLVKTILQEFCYSIPLPRSRKLTDTRISVCACDLILAAYEDQLSLEDLILFFERAKDGRYGSLRKQLTHQLIMEKLQQFRSARHQVYTRLREQKEAELKALGPVARTSPEPTAIAHLINPTLFDAILPGAILPEAILRDPLRKIS